MPVPRDGALLGWVSDRQASSLLSVYHGYPEGPAGRRSGCCPWSAASRCTGRRSPRSPSTTVGCGSTWTGASSSTSPLSWPGNQGRVLGALAEQGPGLPGARLRRHRAALPADEFWLPAGVYMDHWMLREGVPAPPASHLLALPGTVDLSDRLALSAGA
jgi:hypothetical protein